jgi:flagellar M-ring protein FliF
MNLLQTMSTRGKLLAGASVLGIVLVAFFMVQLATKPSYQTLAAGQDPSQTGKITATLAEQGITHRLANGGTAVEVVEADVSKARVALAGSGLSTSGPTQEGWAQFDKQKLGASDFQQKVAYQRALEGQIAQTVGQVAGVTGATVQLTMPEDQLFADEQKPATAAVLLSGDVESAAVKGIANLVASAVPNLKSSSVTITNGNGQMLWPTGDSAGSGAASKTAAEARYDAQLTTQLQSIIARTVGPEKAQVRVKSDLNVDATTRDELRYERQGTPIETKTDTEEREGQGGAAGGAAGAAGNIPTYAQGGGGGGGNSNYEREQEATKFGVGKTVTRTRVAPGAVQRLNVALMVDPSVPAATRTQLQTAIERAAGIDNERGDQIDTSVVPFVKAPAAEAKSGPPVGDILGYAKYAGLGLGALLFLFFMRRHLKRREDADLIGEPVWLNQIEQPRPVAELATGGDPATQPMLTSHPNRRRQQIEQAVQREPERVVQALRAWMSEDPV